MKRTMLSCMMATLAVTLTGCSHDEMDMSEMMKPPARSAELDRLDPFMGTWQGEWSMKGMGSDEVMKGSGKTIRHWDADKRIMIERWEGDMGGNEMVGVSVWAWDDRAGCFKTWFFDSYGMTGNGTVRYDEDENKWYMKSAGNNLSTGDKTRGQGAIQLVDDDTMKWEFTEKSRSGLITFFEMEGTSRRK